MRCKTVRVHADPPRHAPARIEPWDAMWPQVQIFLYDWWPLKGRIRVFDNLCFARVSVMHT